MSAGVGRRGAYLLITSLLYLGHGAAFLLAPATRTGRSSLSVAASIAPLKVWAVCWLVAGVIAAWSAFRHGPRQDRWGFFALIVMATTWATFYFAAAFVGAGTGFAGGFIGAMLYLSLAGAILVVSGWPEPRVRG